jgi:hypothetical protein
MARTSTIDTAAPSPSAPMAIRNRDTSSPSAGGPSRAAGDPEATGTSRRAGEPSSAAGQEEREGRGGEGKKEEKSLQCHQQNFQSLTNHQENSFPVDAIWCKI